MPSFKFHDGGGFFFKMKVTVDIFTTFIREEQIAAFETFSV